MNIILGAMVSLSPYSPGKAWHRLHYLVGLQKLGHDVHLVEDIEPEWCIDERGQRVPFEQSINRTLLAATLEPFGLMDRASVIYDRGQETFGRSRDSLIALSREADLLINWSGHVKTEFILDNVRRLAYLDLDPVFTQLWHQTGHGDLNFTRHDVFFSAGLNIGSIDSDIPNCGVEWRHLLPPVVLEHWRFHIDPSCPRFTTLATLSPFGDVWYRGERYGSKHDELGRLAELPRRVRRELEVAVNYYGDEEAALAVLKANRWFVSDAAAVTDLCGYQRFIARSRAEIGIAQHAYVKARSGWFSDRWSHYLASGKPVLAQSTGFEEQLPTGRGLLSFASLEEAVEGIESIDRDYASHCRAAREFVEEFLDYRTVLPRLLEACAAG